MKLSDIIKNDKDRVFKVNPECFIIFTGDTITDQKPFIRIGNWLDLPAETIPLTENIIITDLMCGNPSYEQFNIDIKYLPTNRYIGSSTAINKFLKYQKVFGLDLENAEIIDAEKDIPEISKSRNISDKNSFIGIFYNDGNFKITHKKKDILDLKTGMDNSYGDIQNHENIYNNVKYSSRYNSSGFLFLENNPFFYDNNNIVSYLFPRRYYSLFDDLEINPRNITAIIHPSSNFLGITKFLKWKHFSQGKIHIFTDHEDRFAPIKNLFNKSTVNISSFSTLSHTTKSGFIVKSIPESYNLEITHASENIKYAYIKGIKNLKKVLKKQYNFICINYSIFEDSNLLLKSAKCPILIVDDGNPNISKLSALDNNILLQNYQYRFIRHDSHKTVKDIFNNILPENIIEDIFNGDIKDSSLKDLSDSEKFNCLSCLKYIYKTTQNRKIATKIRKFFQDSKLNVNIHNKDFFIDLHITGKNIFETASEITDQKDHKIFVSDEIIDEKVFNNLSMPLKLQKEYHKIFEDRDRLSKLLTLFAKESPYKKEIAELKKAIQERKKILENDFLKKKHREILNITDLFHEDENMLNHHEDNSLISKVKEKFSSKSTDNLQKSSTDNFILEEDDSSVYVPKYNYKGTIEETDNISNNHNSKNNRIHKNNKNLSKSSSKSANNRNKKLGQIGDDSSSNKISLIKGSLFLLIILIFSLLSFWGYKKYSIYHENKISEQRAAEKLIQAQKIEKEKAEKAAKEKMLTEKYSIKVGNKEIFEFTNKIAVKNGYNPFPNGYKRTKNPNWIFPGNKFKFPDGEIVTVKKGDTLWDISEKKLSLVFMTFYSNIDKIDSLKRENQELPPELIKETKQIIYTEKQQNDFNKILGTTQQ